MTMNKIYSKIWVLLVCVILNHGVCLLYYKMGFQHPLHLEIKPNEIQSFQHDHFRISITERHNSNDRDRFPHFANKHLRCNIFTQMTSNSILSENGIFLICQHKQTVRKYWIASSYIGIRNSLYTMNLGYFLKIW